MGELTFSSDFHGVHFFDRVCQQYLNQQETVTNVESLKACMILLSSGRMDSKTLNNALIAFTLMERYLIHFEDNYRQVCTQAEKQTRRENLPANQG